MTRRLRSTSAAGTQAIGAALAEVVRPGDVLSLEGELGAGKTCLVQGLAAALGSAERATSPTFVLSRRLPSEPPVVHVDAWRLTRLVDVDQLGDDVLGADVITVVEWGEVVGDVLPTARLTVELTVEIDADGEPPRRISLTGHGAWAHRLEKLRGPDHADVEPAAPEERGG